MSEEMCIRDRDIFVIILIAIYVKFKTRVMRKSLLYVFAVICTMGFFTACGDCLLYTSWHIDSWAYLPFHAKDKDPGFYLTRNIYKLLEFIGGYVFTNHKVCRWIKAEELFIHIVRFLTSNININWNSNVVKGNMEHIIPKNS